MEHVIQVNSHSACILSCWVTVGVFGWYCGGEHRWKNSTIIFERKERIWSRVMLYVDLRKELIVKERCDVPV